MSTYDPYDIKAAQRRVCIKRALRRAQIDIPKEIIEDEEALITLAASRGIEPLKWDDVKASNKYFAELVRTEREAKAFSRRSNKKKFQSTGARTWDDICVISNRISLFDCREEIR